MPTCPSAHKRSSSGQRASPAFNEAHAEFDRIVKHRSRESLVADIFMPIVGAVTGGLDFSNYFVRLSRSVTANSLAEAKKQGAVLAYGNFITVAINFLIIAACLFLVVRLINRLKAEEAEKPVPALTKTEELLQEIRDLLAKRA